MSKLCKCASPKCGHCIIELDRKYIHVKGGANGKFGRICSICGCDAPEPNPNDIGDCESFEAYLKHARTGECE
jgi:hypothetical protein